MKYLSDYVQDEQTKLFEEIGLFFAFNDAQWKEGVAKNGHLKPEVTKWTSIGAGGYLPTVNIKKFEAGMDDICKRGIETDLAENGREGVLKREIGNYEVTYTGELDDPNFRDAIRDYKFTEEEVRKAYKECMELDYA